MAMEGYGSRFIVGTFGIPVSRLHYWDRTNVVKPSLRPAAGRGTRRLYSFRDLVELVVVSSLRDIGISLQRVRKCVEFLREQLPHVENPLADLSLVTDGETVFLLTDDAETVLDTLRKQFVWSLPISAWLRSAREAVENASAKRTEKVTVAGRSFTVTIEQDPEDGWWVGLVDELPGCGSQGTTLEELREMVVDAIRGYLIVRGEIAEDDEEESQGVAV
jgi:predicted RNase H-like HicB family nuclease/DNA-binding transcriptional MerR regulator